MPSGGDNFVMGVSTTIGERIAGKRPSRTHALVAGAAVALVTGVATYRLLRSADDGADGDDSAAE
jgi:hypothetical protein